MANRKNTKRALLASALALLLCVSMLIGTTFAWFTDSVTSGKNQIISGTLDIELNYKNANMEKFEKVEGKSNLFVDADGNDILWEPGAASVVYLELKNEGTLALKYRLSVLVKDIVTGSDGAALSKVLRTAVVEINKDDVGTYKREDAIKAATDVEAESVLDYKKEDVMEAGADPLYLAMIVYFPAEIGNTFEGAVYNRTDKVTLETELGLSLIATQATVEKDSFDKDYDKDAELAVYVSDADSLQAALNSGNGIPVILTNDIEIVGGFTVTTSNTIVDLNGHAITSTPNDERDSVPFKASGANAELTILDSAGGGKVFADGNNQTYNIAVWAYDGAQIKIYGGDFSNADESDLIYASNPANAGTKAPRIEIYGGTFSSVRGTDNMGGQQPTCVRLLNIKNGYDQTPYGQIEVYGGTFIDFDINRTDDWPAFNPTGSWMAKGYYAVATLIDDSVNPAVYSYTVYKIEYPDSDVFEDNASAVAVTEDGNVLETKADIQKAINAGGTIYFKQGATVPTLDAHVNVTSDLTIYANGANFGGKDISIGTYAAPENKETTINIYNAKNLTVWGQPTGRDGEVWNVNLYDCVNDGCGFLMYRNSDTDKATINFTMTNCTGTGYTDSFVHTSADGTIKIIDCTFNNNCAPVNIAHKQSGDMTILVENCVFNECGKYNPTDDYFAPARFANNSDNGTMNVTLKNNTFNKTIGTNGDILLGDYRDGKKNNTVTAEIITDAPVMVKDSNGPAHSYAGGTIVVFDHD